MPPMITTTPIAMPAAAPPDILFFDDFAGEAALVLAALVVAAVGVCAMLVEGRLAVEVTRLTGVVAGVCEDVAATVGGIMLVLVGKVELVLGSAPYIVVDPIVLTMVSSSVSVAEVMIALVDVNIDTCVPMLLDTIAPRDVDVL
jgi:hypothetical protein